MRSCVYSLVLKTLAGSYFPVNSCYYLRQSQQARNSVDLLTAIALGTPRMPLGRRAMDQTQSLGAARWQTLQLPQRAPADSLDAAGAPRSGRRRGCTGACPSPQRADQSASAGAPNCCRCATDRDLDRGTRSRPHPDRARRPPPPPRACWPPCRRAWSTRGWSARPTMRCDLGLRATAQGHTEVTPATPRDNPPQPPTPVRLYSDTLTHTHTYGIR